VACAQPAPSAEQVRAAFEAASRGEIAGCEPLDGSEWGGYCRFTAVVASGGDCSLLPEGEWRDECAFDRADKASTHDLVAAMRACSAAGRFRVDCARHVAVQAQRLEPGISPELAAAMAGVVPEVGPGFVAATRDQAWVDMAAHTARLGLALCAGEPPGCEQGVAHALERRWTHAARENAAVRRALCEGESPRVTATARLNNLEWERSPLLDAAVLRARAAVCPP
jgi:hypothetical protein